MNMISPVAALSRCPDCHAAPGVLHSNGCDIERCPDCGRQAAGCDCTSRQRAGLPWTGEYPGVDECRELGWYARLVVGHGWVRCDADAEGAAPDLNRLMVEATWNPDQGRYTVPVAAEFQEDNRFQELDEAIVAHIEARRGHPTNSMKLEEIARKLIVAGNSRRTAHPVAWRLIDRRMQAMRRSGRLVFGRPEGGGRKCWLVIPAAARSK